MNALPPPNQPLGHTPAEPPAVVDDAPPEAVQQRIKARIEHLFRGNLRRNEIHPLMHLVLRYRSENKP